jgi:hypothetical protein
LIQNNISIRLYGENAGSSLSLQRLHELKIPALNENTTMITEAAYSRQDAVYNDPNSEDGRPTIANYIKRIFW